MERLRICLLYRGIVVAFFWLLAACSPKKMVTTDVNGMAELSDVAYLNEVIAHVPTFEEFSAKMKFTVEYGKEKFSVGGSLKMKKDEVIQLSLVAVGIFEAAKIEITPERLVVIDRVGRRYLDMPYATVSFFAESKINFYTLQALFWNELFLPGVQHVGKRDLKAFKVDRTEEVVTLSYQQNKQLTYSFLTALMTGVLQEARVYVDDKYRLDWMYNDFQELGSNQFPVRMNITVHGIGKQLRANFQFSRCETKADYESVRIPSKYKQVDERVIFKELLSL